MREIEAKWQKRWEDAGIFQPQIGNREKFYLTAAFPYPNSPQHIGHGRTYTTTDIYARYMRMKGKNVLFPMGFHVTGTPVLAMAKRIADKDKEVLEIFEKIYKIPKEVSEGLTDPRKLVTYFSHEIEAGMKEMGYSIDWRRKFYSYDPQFNRFIHWQFAKLNQAGYIKKGEHPVPWCPVGNTAVGAHDTRGDIDPQIEEISGILFPFLDGFLVCATYRPETIYGVTNIWVNPKATYVKAASGGRILYVSKECLPSLSMQIEIEPKGEVNPDEMMKHKAKNPITQEEIPILPATFVNPGHGTGVVMSVPAHAPYDYLAIRDAGLEGKIRFIQVLRLDGFGEHPAKEMCEKMGVRDQNDPKAELATAEIYKKEAHTGVMVAGEFAGMRGVEAKERVKEKMIAEGMALSLYEISNGPIYSRFGGLVGVKIVKDQWFIDYANAEWKSKTHSHLSSMRILPEKTRKDYEYTIGWLKQKACTRSHGLGTSFPFDQTKMIEALSDSTIYMAFYTIAHIAMRMEPEKLTDELFDYVFLGKEPKAKLPPEAELMRREFLYWYPLDSRHSATDLIHNHLTYFIFNHTAIFWKEHWPKQIVTNGFVLMDGKKMSKSMGNIMPIRQAIREFGADAVRFMVVSGADLSSDTDFNRPAAEGIVSRMRLMMGVMERHACSKDDGEKDSADRWILSRIHRRAIRAPQMYENFQLRELALELFYETFNDVQWYLKRAKKPKLREFFEVWVPLVAPFLPHFAEEMWEKLGKKHYVDDAPFAVAARMPDGDAAKVDDELEEAEEYLLKVKEDIQSIMKLLKIKNIGKIELFVASGWKRKLRSIASEEKKFDAAMKRAMDDPEIKAHAKDAARVLQSYMKNIGALGKTMDEKFELEALKSATKLLSEEFGAQVIVAEESKSGSPKASYALPGKPSILIS
ncbi:MAG: leucine--tRNA ligase [Candidatus Micrarchaeota archaeon]|nr:leucine--tRNA ligase [Candidatus Micrarchaeota archaeon]